MTHVLSTRAVKMEFFDSQANTQVTRSKSLRSKDLFFILEVNNVARQNFSEKR